MSFSGTQNLSNDALGHLVEQLLDEVTALRERVSELEAENAALKEENTRLKGLKGLKLKPSGMEKAKSSTRSKRKNMKRAKCRSPVLNEEHKLSVGAPAGSRFKGYDDFVVKDLRIEGRLIRYRRERWVTPDGKLIVAPLPAG